MSSTSDETTEADLRDLLVEAFFAKNNERVDELGAALVKAESEDVEAWTVGESVHEASLLDPQNIPRSFKEEEDLALLDGHVPDERFEAIMNGSKLTVEERALLKDLWVRNFFEGDIDFDEHWSFNVCATQHRDGRTIFSGIMWKGYSFTEVTRTFIGAFGSINEALDHFRGWGFIDHDDYQQRRPKGQSRRPTK